jgi:hypothetical protein
MPKGEFAMETRKKYVRAFGLLLILLALGSFIGTKESKAALPAEPENTLTIMAELSWPEGSPLRSDMVQLSFGDTGSNYQLGAAEVFQISGLPRSGEVLMSVLDRQKRPLGTMTLSLSEGAVIDAVTGEDGIGHIMLRKDTEVLPLSFSLTDSGSIQCGLWLTKPGFMGQPW